MSDRRGPPGRWEDDPWNQVDRAELERIRFQEPWGCAPLTLGSLIGLLLLVIVLRLVTAIL